MPKFVAYFNYFNRVYHNYNSSNLHQIIAATMFIDDRFLPI